MSREATLIPPQYVDDSLISKELQLCVKLVDLVVELHELRYTIPQSLRLAKDWANSRSSFLLNEMDRLDSEPVTDDERANGPRRGR